MEGRARISMRQRKDYMLRVRRHKGSALRARLFLAGLEAPPFHRLPLTVSRRSCACVLNEDWRLLRKDGKGASLVTAAGLRGGAASSALTDELGARLGFAGGDDAVI